jgi:hypothetical protein
MAYYDLPRWRRILMAVLGIRRPPRPWRTTPDRTAEK